MIDAVRRQKERSCQSMHGLPVCVCLFVCMQRCCWCVRDACGYAREKERKDRKMSRQYISPKEHVYKKNSIVQILISYTIM